MPAKPRLALTLIAATPALPFALLAIPLATFIGHTTVQHWITDGGLTIGLGLLGAVATTVLCIVTTTTKLPQLACGLGGLLPLLGGALSYSTLGAQFVATGALAAPEDRGELLAGLVAESAHHLTLGTWLAATLWFAGGTSLMLTALLHRETLNRVFWSTASAVVLIAGSGVAAIETLKRAAEGQAFNAFAHAATHGELAHLGAQLVRLEALRTVLFATVTAALVRTRDAPQFFSAVTTALTLFIGAASLNSWVHRSLRALEVSEQRTQPDLVHITGGTPGAAQVTLTHEHFITADGKTLTVVPPMNSIGLAPDASIRLLSEVAKRCYADSQLLASVDPAKPPVLAIVGSTVASSPALPASLKLLEVLGANSSASLPLRFVATCLDCPRASTDGETLEVNGERFPLQFSPQTVPTRPAVIALEGQSAETLMKTLSTLRAHGYEPVALLE